MGVGEADCVGASDERTERRTGEWGTGNAATCATPNQGMDGRTEQPMNEPTNQRTQSPRPNERTDEPTNPELATE
ncbi:hypothetical protein B9T62_03575 [Paenibacillus donghaensis]|uniref:Uncharacterized protein n=1 Tax=Paenibacillus donghaensis TaxID=414771 RepID=A0A2Z2KAW0_9BACL|nr:hypothetical protein B9T62_03575 [Paenibacillus donghaensis]